MTDPHLIPPGPDRAVWVLAVDLPPDAAAALVAGPLAAILGVDHVDPAQVELVDADELQDYGFLRFLAEGHGLAPEALAPDALRLDALRGSVLLVWRGAVSADNGRIAPKPPLRLIGRYGEPPTPPHEAMPDYPSAHGTVDAVARRKPSDAAMSGRVATIVLLLLALFVVLFIWMAA